MQIRYLETLVGMSKNAGTKVIFMPAGNGLGNEKDIEKQMQFLEGQKE